jgi:hypothetical protein
MYRRSLWLARIINPITGVINRSDPPTTMTA